jgi:hypothetical protein
MNDKKQTTIIFVVILLLIFSGVFIYLGVKKRSSLPASSPVGTSTGQAQTIQNIVFDHNKKKVFILNPKGQRTEILKEIKFTEDDLFLNIGNNEIVLYNYTQGNSQTSLPVSFVFRIENNKVEPVFQVQNQKIFWFTDKDNYGYSTSNSSFVKWKDTDIETTKIYNLGFKSNRNKYDSLFTLQNDGSRVNELAVYDSYITNHSCAYCGLDTIITTFLVSDNYQVYGAVSTDIQKSFLRLYNRENPETEDYVEENRNTKTLVKEISVGYTPTLLSLRGNDFYVSSKISKNNFKNYKVNLNDFSIVELSNYGQSEEVVY